MVEQIEISSLDLRYESFRLKSKKIENTLLAPIINHGIQEPLKGVDAGDEIHILLDGFIRYRCAKKLNIQTSFKFFYKTAALNHHYRYNLLIY